MTITPEEELEFANTGIRRSRDGNFVWDANKMIMTFTVTWDDERLEMTPEEKAGAVIDKLPMIGWNMGRPEALQLIAAAIRAARIDALEAAAKLCDASADYWEAFPADEAATADTELREAAQLIRALANANKEKPAAPDDATG